MKIGKFQDEANLATEATALEQPEEEDMSWYTYNYLGTVTLHSLFPLYTFDSIGTGLSKVWIGKGSYLNVTYDNEEGVDKKEEEKSKSKYEQY